MGGSWRNVWNGWKKEETSKLGAVWFLIPMVQFRIKYDDNDSRSQSKRQYQGSMITILPNTEVAEATTMARVTILAALWLVQIQVLAFRLNFWSQSLSLNVMSNFEKAGNTGTLNYDWKTWTSVFQSNVLLVELWWGTCLLWRLDCWMSLWCANCDSLKNVLPSNDFQPRPG